MRRCRERLAAARKAAKARAAAGQDPPPGAGNAGGRGKRGKKPPRAVRNITDPDSRAMHCTRNGAVQACNCQLHRADDGLVLAARATQDANDAAQVEPTWPPSPPPGRSSPPGTRPAGTTGLVAHRHVTYDNGYFSKDNCAAPGPDRLIATGSWQSPASSGPHMPPAGTTTPATRWPITCPPGRAATSTAAARRWPRAASAS